MSLAVTVGAGCGLLVVNAAVLAALYCKRGRLGKLRQRLALLAPPGESAQLVESYVRRRTTAADVDDPSSSPATAAVVVDGAVSSSGGSLVPAPPPPPPSAVSPPRRRTAALTARRAGGNPDRIALTTALTNPDSSRAANPAILCVTSSVPCADVTNHVTSSSNDTVV